MDHIKEAADNFMKGYNCAQSVLLAFTDVTGLDEHTSVLIGSSLGAGISGAREVCGAVNAAAIVLGLCKGYDVPGDINVKRAHYAKVTEMLDEFRAAYDTVVCRELLAGLKISNIASERTPEYYKTRPCLRVIMKAAEIVEKRVAAQDVDGENE